MAIRILPYWNKKTSFALARVRQFLYICSEVNKDKKKKEW